jgi:hypothetical protein
LSKGFEGWLALVPENKGWLGAHTAIRANALFADSESMQLNQEIKERPGKLTYGRSLKASNRVIGELTPGGDIEFQFRSDDMVPLCLAHFQKYIGTAFGGSGTLVGSSQFTFVPEKGVPNFSGSAFGTGSYTSPKGDCFTVGVVKKLFDTTSNNGTNAQWYRSCLVDELMFSMTAGEDAKCKASFKAGTVDYATAIGSTSNPNSSFGSYSALPSFEFWTATLAYAGGALEISKFEWSSKNNMTPYRSIGSKNPSRYNFGRYDISGSLDLDFPYDGMKHFGSMIGGSAFSLTATMFNGTSDWVTFNFPNCRLKPIEVNMKGGDQETTFALPWVAYESEDGVTSPVTVVVHTLTYGSTPITRV